METIVQDKFAEVKTRFQNLFDLFENQLNGQRSQEIYAFRKKAIDRLPGLSFPTRRDEDWKYTSVNRILQLPLQLAAKVNLTSEQIAPFRFSELPVHLLVFVNGQYQEEWSNVSSQEGLLIASMKSAIAEEAHRDLIEKYLEEWSEKDRNPFVALNAAFAKSGLFIHVAKNTVVEKPIHLLYLNTREEGPVFSNPQLLLAAERSSQVTVLESHENINGDEAVHFTNVVNRFQVGENAHVKHFKLQNISKEAYLIYNCEAHQARNSTYSSFVVDLGGRIVRNNLSSILESEGTSTNLHGIYMAGGVQHIDNQTFMDHAYPHCNSNELYKGILDGKGRGVFNGKVTVRPDAQKTNAFQQNASLVLSETATMDSKPQLEIFADDVKCSHGATIGQLEEESIYYLRARGLSMDAAKALLQKAFLKEVLEYLPIEAVSTYANSLIDRRFEEGF